VSTNSTAAKSSSKANPTISGLKKTKTAISSICVLNVKKAISGILNSEDADLVIPLILASTIVPVARLNKDASNAKKTGSLPTSRTPVNKQFSTVTSHHTTFTETMEINSFARNALKASSLKADTVLNVRSLAASNALPPLNALFVSLPKDSTQPACSVLIPLKTASLIQLTTRFNLMMKQSGCAQNAKKE